MLKTSACFLRSAISSGGYEDYKNEIFTSDHLKSLWKGDDKASVINCVSTYDLHLSVQTFCSEV